MKKDLPSLLVPFVRLRSPTAIVLTLSLLRSASIYEETAATLSAEGCQVIPFLATVIDNTDVREIQVDVVCTLFNLSFHDPCLEMISRTDIWESLTVLVRDRCNQAVSLMYRLSSTEANREYMTEIGLAALVGELVNDFAPR